MRLFSSAESAAPVQTRDASPPYSSATTAASSRTRLAIEPGKRWIAGFSAKSGSRSIAASFFGSSVPARCLSTYGPANAFITVTCWSIAKPTSSANGSSASSFAASGSSVNQSASGTVPILRNGVPKARDRDAEGPGRGGPAGPQRARAVPRADGGDDRRRDPRGRDPRRRVPRLLPRLIYPARVGPLDVFSPATRAWFERTFAAPTPAQERGWPAIASGAHVLIQAPTGSGKTLTAFLYALDKLNASPGEALRVLYVSPLKALNYDIERNLRGPLAGLESKVRVAVRTGDTPAKERRELLKEPPDILITTPESLYLMLTSQARETLRSVDTLILDEVHAVAGTKRGAHMAISVERLQALVEQPMQRIGLSATQRPIEEIGRFVSGGRDITIVDAGTRKELDLEVVVPVEDMRELGSTASLSQPVMSDGVEMDPGTEHGAQSIWPSIYPEILRLGPAPPPTDGFVNNPPPPRP